MPISDDPVLNALLERANAAFAALSPEEQQAHRREQAISFAYGQVKLSGAEITMADVEAVYDWRRDQGLIGLGSGIIVAMDPTGIIGVDRMIPWHYKADFRRFKYLTMGGTLIMGHTTWEAIPKPLKGRRVLVLSRQANPTSRHPADTFEFYNGLDTAIIAAGSDQHGYNYPCQNSCVWFCGGGEVYNDLLTAHHGDVEFVDVTIVPKVTVPLGGQVTRFPVNLLEQFRLIEERVDVDDSCLVHRIYQRV